VIFLAIVLFSVDLHDRIGFTSFRSIILVNSALAVQNPNLRLEKHIKALVNCFLRENTSLCVKYNKELLNKYLDRNKSYFVHYHHVACLHMLCCVVILCALC
jgi:hypothetical protein